MVLLQTCNPSTGKRRGGVEARRLVVLAGYYPRMGRMSARFRERPCLKRILEDT